MVKQTGACIGLVNGDFVYEKLCNQEHFSFVSDAVFLLLSSHAEILDAPESKIFFLDQSAVFTCEVVGGTLVWVVNGTQREVHPAEIRRDLVVSEIITDDDTTLETLTIPARAEYNGTRVQCAVLTFGGSDQSDDATMTIQGIAISHQPLRDLVCVAAHELCVFQFNCNNLK